jgi:phosphoglucosamine mutase
VRAEANSELTVEFALVLGRAVATVFAPGPIIIGADTRRSSSMLAAAVGAGAASAGADVVDFGTASTPCLASYSRHLGIAAVMISASHNPAADNGLKVFAPGGVKLDDADQQRVEDLIAAYAAGADESMRPAVTGAAVGRVALLGTPLAAAILSPFEVDAFPVREFDGYVDAVVDAAGGPGALAGVTVAFDAANGAAYRLGPRILRSLGAEVIELATEPDGMNINDGCGSTDLEGLARRLVDLPAAIGIAVDGDADRCLAVDEAGERVDGDQILAVCAIDMAARGVLANEAIAITVMSNLGLRVALADRGIGHVDTPVGDRHVVEAMNRHGLVLGGEQSGHVIFADTATTGDGVLTAVRLLEVVSRNGGSLHQLVGEAMRRLPQAMVNVSTKSGAPDEAAEGRLAEAIAAAEAELGQSGRVLVRKSGTEPLIRIMVEATDEATAEGWANRIAAALG